MNESKPIRRALVVCFLLGLGCLQMAGDVLGMPRLKALAAASQVSPAMKVFTAHQGYETHAARFSLHWLDTAGRPQSLALDPSSYAGVRGPYNRRNVYGAALAYGPILRADPRTRPMQESVMRHAFCVPGTLRRELGIPQDARELRVLLVPTRADARRDLQLGWEARCDG
jgi:hypothetical protein